MLIKNPWEELYCDRCIHCINEDMCGGYFYGMSNAYCPQIKYCGKFKERILEEQSDRGFTGVAFVHSRNNY